MTCPNLQLKAAKPSGHQSPKQTGAGWPKIAETPTVDIPGGMSEVVQKANLGGGVGCTERKKVREVSMPWGGLGLSRID